MIPIWISVIITFICCAIAWFAKNKRHESNYNKLLSEKYHEAANFLETIERLRFENNVLQDYRDSTKKLIEKTLVGGIQNDA